MKNFLISIYEKLPNVFHNILISGFNIHINNKRHSGTYKKWKKEYKRLEGISLIELRKRQLDKLNDLLSYTHKKSPYYQEIFNSLNFKNVTSLDDLKVLPILTKEDLRQNINDTVTISKAAAMISKTGGTTGKSLAVFRTKNDIQERNAIMSIFRGKQGYALGQKTAWFSGKSILSKNDIKKNRFWKTDYWHKVRYYSTFHMKQDFLKYYILNLIKFKPKFIIGFPSTMYEIATYGLAHNMEFPANTVKAIFPTAESVTPELRSKLELFFKTKVFDQYASSEGAPFIFECANGNLHMDLLTGVFEVLDDNDEPTDNGRLILTSFTTYGTPLIRYDIGDGLILSDKICTCGNNNPLVKEILGRVNDFVYSPETGKINLGNISNALKDTKGIVKFQVVQNELDSLVIRMIIDQGIYTKESERIFLKNWRDRVGDDMKIFLDFVSDIDVEKSGKYRFVKNNIKHLLND